MFERVGINNVKIRQRTSVRIDVINVSWTQIGTLDGSAYGVGHDLTGLVTCSHPSSLARGSVAQHLCVNMRAAGKSELEVFQNQRGSPFCQHQSVAELVVWPGGLLWCVVSLCERPKHAEGIKDGREYGRVAGTGKRYLCPAGRYQGRCHLDSVYSGAAVGINGKSRTLYAKLD